MSSTETFRCYYDDGTILESQECPTVNNNNSPLINSEFQIVEQVVSTPEYPWFLIIMGLVVLFSKKGK